MAGAKYIEIRLKNEHIVNDQILELKHKELMVSEKERTSESKCLP